MKLITQYIFFPKQIPNNSIMLHFLAVCVNSSSWIILQHVYFDHKSFVRKGVTPLLILRPIVLFCSVRERVTFTKFYSVTCCYKADPHPARLQRLFSETAVSTLFSLVSLVEWVSIFCYTMYNVNIFLCRVVCNLCPAVSHPHAV